MPHYLDADYSKTYLLRPAVDDWVPSDHPVRFIREVVECYPSEELLEGFDDGSSMGRPAYAPSLLLKIWLFGYYQGLRSSRRLEQACKEWLPLMWLAGELSPDHNTLARFWKRHRKLIRGVYGHSLRLAIKFDLVGLVLHAIDGTKIQAWGSSRRAVTREQLEQKLERIEERISEIEEQIEAAEASEANEKLDALSSDLQDRKALRAAIEQELTTAVSQLRQHPLEPEARVMDSLGLGYNAQIAVDAKAGIIVAQAVVSDQNDTQQLVPVLDMVKQNLGQLAEETLADGGYNTAAALGEAAQKGYSVLLAEAAGERPRDPNRFHSTAFEYDPGTDTFRCPNNERLVFTGTYIDKRRGGVTVRRYRAPVAVCRQCPLRELCTKDKRGRVVELRPFHEAVQRHRFKREREDNKTLLRQRSSIAERPFAFIKEHFRFRRARLRGLQGAGLEFAFIVAVHNFARLLSILRKEPNLLATA